MSSDRKLIARAEILGSTISVFQHDLLDEVGLLGQTHSGKNAVAVHKIENEDLLNETIFHELIHILLYKIGRAELSADEGFVEILSNALYQMVTTLEFLEEEDETA